MTPAPKIATIPMSGEYAGCGRAARGSSGARRAHGIRGPGRQPFVASDRRKKVRLAGRSAIRRTR